MKYFEVSRKIDLVSDVSEQDMKQALLDKLQRGFAIGDFVETDDGFNVQIKTGGSQSLIKHSHAAVSVSCKKAKGVARFLVHGHSRVSLSLSIWYGFLFLAILMLGLLPGSIETSTESSGAIDVLVFMILGIFTVYDIDKKLDEAKEGLSTALASLDAEFG